MKINYLFLLYSLSLICIGVNGKVEVADFFPFGVDHGDNIVPENDDEFVNITFSAGSVFPFFNFTHRSLFVNNNGAISFVAGVSQFTPTCSALNVSMVVPFWSDVDTRSSGGSVFYRESTNRDLLSKARTDVAHAFPNLAHVNLGWIFVTTWDNVAFYGASQPSEGCEGKNKRNTFQLALTTDGFHSFAIFYYNNITWTTGGASSGNPCTGLGGVPAKAGFDFGDGATFYTIPGSCSADVINVTEISNVDSPGKWVFRIDSEVEQGGCEDEDLSSLRLRTSPSFISILGHVPLTLTGPCLSNASRVNCIFHDRDKQVVPATLVDPATAECLVPYLYTNGRVTVELDYEILINSSIEHRNVSGYIYTIPPPDYKLNFSIHETGSEVKVQAAWDPENFHDEPLLEMDLAQFNGTNWVDHGVLMASVPNSGIYEGPVDNVNGLKGISQTFVVSLKPLSGFDGLQWAPDNYLYSGPLHTNYGETENTFDAWCQSWYELDPGPPSGIRPCPPLLEQVQQDLNFESDTLFGSVLEFFHPGAEASFRERNPVGQSGQQCVYKGGQILIGPPGGGTADLYSPKGIRGTFAHQWHDVRPYLYCCKWSSNREESCRKYYAKRPSDAGTTYVPPRPGSGAGDPHITTFDLLTYTFNGVGEFWMIKDTGFGMQARMEQYINPETQEAMYASIFTGFSFLVKGEAQAGAQNSQVRVQVQLLPQIQGGGMQVLLDTVAIDLLSDDTEPLVISHFGVFITILGRREVTVAFSMGYTFSFITLDGLSINIEASASAQLRGFGNPRGLLGIFDGDNANDLTDPDGNILPITSNIETIHRSFGTKWRTTEVDTLFSYGPGKSHAIYQNEGFLPSFGTPDWGTLPENVRETCGNDRACIYDYVNTGSITFANNTKQVGEHFNETLELVDKVVVMCEQPLNPKNGYFSADNFFVGSVATFHCNKDKSYTLVGKNSSTCLSDDDGNRARWSNSVPECTVTQSGDGFRAVGDNFLVPFTCILIVASYAIGI